MTPITGPATPRSDAAPDRSVRAIARQLEGVFVQRLFAAMRETVPHEGAVDAGAGEEMFTSLLDERMATVVPSQWHHGLGEALVRQLQSALAHQSAPAPTLPESPE